MADIQENGLHNEHIDTSGKIDLKSEVTKAQLSEVKVTEYLRESLDKVAASEGFLNYDLIVDHGSSIGDGFVGLIYKAIIKEIDSEKKLKVVLKIPPFSKARRNDFGAMEFFRREVSMYKEVLPEFVKVQQEKGIPESEGFYNFPKCYFAEFSVEKDDSVIIMEDLRESDCRLWDKFIPINLEHAKLLVGALGRFHAVSFALKAQKPELFEKFKEMKDYLFGKFFADEKNTRSILGALEQAANSIDKADTESRNKALKLKENYVQLVDHELAEPYAVVGHGDCWSNNFMYQYNGDEPQRTVLLDWQVSRYCSPVLDLVHFIFACTDEGLRANHYNELLDIYHQSLKKLLDRLGGDTDSQFPYEALLQQLKQFGKFGIVMGSLIIPISSTRNEDLPDMDEMAEAAEDMNKSPEAKENMMKSLLKGNDNSTRRLRAVIMDSIRLGYL